MSRKNRSVDLAFQKVQEPLLQGLSALVILADCLVKNIQQSKTTNVRETVDQVMDCIAIFHNANWNLNMRRRDVIKPDVHSPYTRLCKEDIKSSSKLFGDDLSKYLKEMTDAKKAGQQMQRNSQSVKPKHKTHRFKPYEKASKNSNSNWHGSSHKSHNVPF